MIRAYFDYNPVGRSVYILENEGQEPKETTIETPDAKSMVETIATLMGGSGVTNLYCNKAAMGLESIIRQYMLQHYNNYNLTIEEYQ